MKAEIRSARAGWRAGRCRAAKRGRGHRGRLTASASWMRASRAKFRSRYRPCASTCCASLYTALRSRRNLQEATTVTNDHTPSHVDSKEQEDSASSDADESEETEAPWPKIFPWWAVNGTLAVLSEYNTYLHATGDPVAYPVSVPVWRLMISSDKFLYAFGFGLVAVYALEMAFDSIEGGRKCYERSVSGGILVAWGVSHLTHFSLWSCVGVFAVATVVFYGLLKPLSQEAQE